MSTNEIAVSVLPAPFATLIRALLSNQLGGHEMGVALAWCAGIMLWAYILATGAYKKRG